MNTNININKNHAFGIYLSNLNTYIDLFDNEPDIKKLLVDINTEPALKYETSFLVPFIKTFSKLFQNFSNLDITSIYNFDNRNYHTTNNEYIILIKLKCFKFIIKILSDVKNGDGMPQFEIGCAKFINDNFILNNICPHFCLFIDSINIGESFVGFKLRHKINYGIIYHFIEPFIYNNIEFSDLKYLIKYINNISFSQSESDSILFNIFFQIFYSLCALAKYEINHNDLRSSNIMLQNDYHNINTYTHYKIIRAEKTTDYYIPNLGFKVKIIDFGLTHSNKVKALNNNTSLTYELFSSTGIGMLYSEYYDIHYLINEILNINTIIYSHPKVAKFLYKIISKKYIGPYNNNKYVNKYWRLAFPWKIADYIKYNNIKVSLLYDDKQKLIVTDHLYEIICLHIQSMTSGVLHTSIKECIIDPIDNNIKHLKTPIEAIDLFDMYKDKPNDANISQTYILNMNE